MNWRQMDWSSIRDLGTLGAIRGLITARFSANVPSLGEANSAALADEPTVDEEAEADSPLYVDSQFAREWYAMRERGEHDRAAALSVLYSHRREPGGSHPDPRLPAAFSDRAILATLARLKGVTIWPVPSNEGETKQDFQERAKTPKDPKKDPKHAPTIPVWLITYPQPRKRDEAREKPSIAVTQQDEEELMLWRVACMFGFIAREPWRVSDPNAPAGTTTLPIDPAIRALVHRYAHALLLMEFDCSQVFGCPCSEIERQLNAPPPDHPQPTMSIPAQRVKPVITKPKLPSRAGNSGALS